MKYILYDVNESDWELCYCNNGKANITDKEILDACVSHFYVEKFNANEHICIGENPIKNDTRCHIMTQNGYNYIWQVGACVTDREGFIIPHTYYIRKVGILFN